MSSRPPFTKTSIVVQQFEHFNPSQFYNHHNYDIKEYHLGYRSCTRTKSHSANPYWNEIAWRMSCALLFKFQTTNVPIYGTGTLSPGEKWSDRGSDRSPQHPPPPYTYLTTAPCLGTRTSSTHNNCPPSVIHLELHLRHKLFSLFQNDPLI
jgi:hypothetical protein